MANTHKSDRALLFALTAYALLFICAAADYAIHPQLWDAQDYIRFAKIFAQQGYGTPIDTGSWKGMGLPTLLWPLAFVGAPLPITAVVIQGVLYAGVSIWAAKEVSRLDEQLGSAVLLGLLLNPLNVWILNATLSEAFTLIIWIGLAASLLRSENSHDKLVTILFGTALAAYAFQIRAANIVLFCAWCVICVYLMARWRGFGLLVKSALAVAAAAMAALASLPNIIYNARTFDIYSIFPQAPLVHTQLAYGVKYVKYGSSADPAGYGQLFYHNPLYQGRELPEAPVLWYFQNPVRGLGTLGLHSFNAFSFDYHSVYIYDLTPPFPWVFPYLMWLIVVSGVLTVVRVWREIPLQSPPIVFVGLTVLGTIALNSILAVENRFNILPMTALMVMASYGAIRLRSTTWKRRLGMIGLVLSASALLTVGTILMKTTSPTI